MYERRYVVSLTNTDIFVIDSIFPLTYAKIKFDNTVSLDKLLSAADSADFGCVLEFNLYR